ncbi:hypothetical protein A7X89_02415 [Stenotrophomonas maltophilia]|nr:hypothetical protein A7X89_02415 [Stenotrophomonas maltophilia]
MQQATGQALSVNFPAHHGHCDCCSRPASWHRREAIRGQRSTPAGSFHYQICFECLEEIEALPDSQREACYLCALVRHATTYSETFGQFLAGWFGVEWLRASQAA